MAPRKESAAARAQGKRPAASSEPEPRRKARFDPSYFTTAEEYQRFRSLFLTRTVNPGRDIDFLQLAHFGFHDLFARMGWLPLVTLSEPVYPTLVRAFYSKMQFCVGGPITCTMRGQEIRLDADIICQILGVPAVGLRVYELKSWPIIPGFDAGLAIQRLCGLAAPDRVGRPSAGGLTVISRVLHHMICYSLVPRGGHRNEVSYFDGFLIDSILTGRRLHLGYIMLHHMMTCGESSTRILPYGRFLTRVFKEVGLDLSLERDIAPPRRFDTYNEQSMGRMGFEKVNGAWIRKALGQAPAQAPDVEEEAEIDQMEDGIDPQGAQGIPDVQDPGFGVGLDIPPLRTAMPLPEGPQPEHIFSTYMDSEPIPPGPTQSGPSFPEQSFPRSSFADIPPPQAPPASDPWTDLSAQIRSLSSQLGAFSVQFTSVENRLDHFDDRFDIIEDQHAQIQAQQSQILDQYSQIQVQQSQLLDQ